MFTLQFAKQHFPIFNIKQSDNTNFTYLDSAATAHKPKFTIDSLSILFEKHYSNINRGLYKLSGVSNSIYERARCSVSSFIKSNVEGSVIFTENSTSSLNIVQRSFMRRNRYRGKSVLLSVYEHHSNIIPWKLLSINNRSSILYVAITYSGFLSFKHFVTSLSRNIYLSSISSCSNTLGLINKLGRFTLILSKLGIVSVLDGSQSILHNKVNVSSLKCDFFIFSGHKVMAPCGIGVLYSNKKWLRYLLPSKLGGGITYDLNLNYKVVLKEPPHLFEGGTPNLNGACGLLASLNYLNFLGYNALKLNVKKTHFFLKKTVCNLKIKKLVFLPTIKSIHLFEKNPVFLFLSNKHSHDVSYGLDLSNLAIRSGYQCNQPLIEGGLGLFSVNRISYCFYNNFNCIRRLALNLSRSKF